MFTGCNLTRIRLGRHQTKLIDSVVNKAIVEYVD